MRWIFVVVKEKSISHTVSQVSHGCMGYGMGISPRSDGFSTLTDQKSISHTVSPATPQVSYGLVHGLGHGLGHGHYQSDGFFSLTKEKYISHVYRSCTLVKLLYLELARQSQPETSPNRLQMIFYTHMVHQHTVGDHTVTCEIQGS